MPNFITLSRSQGGVVHLNVDHIAAIYTHSDQPEPLTAVVLVGDGEPYLVKESAQEVRDKIWQTAVSPSLAAAARGSLGG